MFFDEIDMYKTYFAKIGFSYAQFVFCLYVFEELGIVHISRDNDFSFKIDKNVKTELNNSHLYNKMLKFLEK